MPVALRDADLMVELAPGAPKDGTAMILRTDRRLGFDATRPWDLIVTAERRHGVFQPETGSVTFRTSHVTDSRFFLRPEVAAAVTPIVSAVGHQTDFTLSDFAADLRAATPSQAAELVVPDRLELLRRLSSARRRLNQALRHRLIERRLRLERCLQSSLFRRPQELLRDRSQLLDQLSERLTHALKTALDERQQRLRIANEKLNLLNPWGVLQRGYSVVRRPDGAVISSAEAVETGESLDVWLHRGKLAVTVTRAERVRKS